MFRPREETIQLGMRIDSFAMALVGGPVQDEAGKRSILDTHANHIGLPGSYINIEEARTAVSRRIFQTISTLAQRRVHREGPTSLRILDEHHEFTSALRNRLAWILQLDKADRAEEVQLFFSYLAEDFWEWIQSNPSDRNRYGISIEPRAVSIDCEVDDGSL